MCLRLAHPPGVEGVRTHRWCVSIRRPCQGRTILAHGFIHGFRTPASACFALPGSGLWLDASVCAKRQPRVPIRSSVVLRRAVAADRSFKRSLKSLRTDLGSSCSLVGWWRLSQCQGFCSTDRRRPGEEMWVSESGRRAVSLQWPAAILALFASVGTLQSAESQAAQAEFFESKIRPLLVESCYPCHSSDAKVRFANLRLDSREGMLKGGDRGAVIVPGDPDASALIRAVRHQDLQMPPSGKLQENQIAALVQWVEIGAPWPNEQKVAGTSPTGREAKAPTSDHWAWKPVRKAPTPPVQQADWPTHDVDKFVLAKLEGEGAATSRRSRPLPPAAAGLVRLDGFAADTRRHQGVRQRQVTRSL